MESIPGRTKVRGYGIHRPQELNGFHNYEEVKSTIVHRKESENGAADALSRRPDYMEELKPDHEAVLAIDKEGSLRYNYLKLALVLRTDSVWEQRIKKAYPGDEMVKTFETQEETSEEGFDERPNQGCKPKKEDGL
ncbi:hypothetical protein K432DRAFT_411498 [Lepidopterella palustris CBS 459.81]|uniref:Uncharacterized protein n=1 Tax=Lepidopterella palustris CBS 459.81 TaxID=1314670 RepID=A0A8E2DW57_9PEZI|nr:hypothetical protein K432DRAFT_411498 [Lepidopterella palustris CBS 459.81]